MHDSKMQDSKEFPDPFTREDGTRAVTRADWAGRRQEIIEALLYYQYGHLPSSPAELTAMEVESAPVLGGRAVEKHIRLLCGQQDALQFEMNLTVPQDQPGPFPVLLTGDGCWGPVPVSEEIVRRGYLLAEFDRTEIARDEADRNHGVYRRHPDCESGTLAAWAWGYQRAVDYLIGRADVDAARIAVTGHSRGGKAALLAGALDQRIALTAPNDSGCGGAGSYRFQGVGSESLAVILQNFPYWFHPRLQDFIGTENQLPFDQHFLLALVAPRALLLTNALEDLWANPSGTQQTYLAARQVFEFLGTGDRIGNHYRAGGHEQNAQDWRTLLNFADKQFFGQECESEFEGMPFPDTPSAFSWTAPHGST